jgi:DNA-binding IclR family transcriptional regulator
MRSADLKTLSTARRILETLELVSEHPRNVNAKVLSRHFGVSLSTAYHLIHTLEACGFVQAGGRDHGLELGPKIPRLYQKYLASGPPVSQLEPVVEEVSERTAARSYLAAWSNRDLEIVKIQGRRGVRELHGLAPGFRGAAHALALGKVFLAYLDPAEWPEYTSLPTLPRFTDRTIDDPQQLQRHLARVRESGVAFDLEEYAEGECCIAAPVFDSQQRLVAALGIAVPTRRFRYEQQLLTELIRQLAGGASTETAPPLPLITAPGAAARASR